MENHKMPIASSVHWDAMFLRNTCIVSAERMITIPDALLIITDNTKIANGSIRRFPAEQERKHMSENTKRPCFHWVPVLFLIFFVVPK